MVETVKGFQGRWNFVAFTCKLKSVGCRVGFIPFSSVATLQLFALICIQLSLCPQICVMVARSLFSGCYAVGLYNFAYDLAVFLHWDMNGIPVGEISSGKVLQHHSPKLGLGHRQFCEVLLYWGVITPSV